MTPPPPAHLMPRGFSRALEPVMDASLGRGRPDQLTRSSNLGTWSLGKPLHRTPRLLTRRADTPHPSRKRLLAPFALPLSQLFYLVKGRIASGYVSCWNVNQHPFREAGLPPPRPSRERSGLPSWQMTFAILSGPNHSCPNTVDMKTFSTSVQKACTFVVATSTKMCTGVSSTRGHPLRFFA